VLVADHLPHGCDLAVLGQAALAPEEPPGPHEWPDGDVERTPRVPAVAQGFVEEREKIRLHGHGPAGPFAVQLRQGALHAIVAHQPVDAVHFVEGPLRGGGKRPSLAPVGRDRVDASHREATGLVAAERLGAMRSQTKGRDQARERNSSPGQRAFVL
jgi:hypothetical protein